MTNATHLALLDAVGRGGVAGGAVWVVRDLLQEAGVGSHDARVGGVALLQAQGRGARQRINSRWWWGALASALQPGVASPVAAEQQPRPTMTVLYVRSAAARVRSISWKFRCRCSMDTSLCSSRFQKDLSAVRAPLWERMAAR